MAALLTWAGTARVPGQKRRQACPYCRRAVYSAVYVGVANRRAAIGRGRPCGTRSCSYQDV